MSTGTRERIVVGPAARAAEPERPARRSRRRGAGDPLHRIGRVVTAVAGVLLVVGASTIGLHDWADAQLEPAAVHDASSAR